MKYFLTIMVLITFSCKEEKKEFIQPDILIEGAEFDLTQLSFKEDVLKLVSKSLDTINNDYTIKNYENASYPTKEEIKNISNHKGITYLDEKRYYFQSLELDSIAQFLGLHTNSIEIETDSNLKIQTCWATAKVFDTLILNSVLHKMYVKYGKTIWMQEYEDELGLQKVVHASTDENGKVVHEIKYKEYDIDYESYLYQYKINSSDDYHQWNLKDRILQIKISDGNESTIDLSSGETESKKYYKIEFLNITKKEYDLVKNTLISSSTANNYPMRIIKPYYIKELDFYTNFSKYYIEESEDGIKVYNFNK
ncbi:hypothetical protein [Aquimarina algiphila]|uniref:hypothetical protein n=1 Tax=Aquimarina algiphila TaxID=2047982 RepID=UPI002490AF45|nr:hypothetical protein [Aquimarina algiphila]